ncbi:hypothetical protein [Mesorhizobium sp.]|uniref:hypothetical protein n=1 Tax=Mesorhizobium sp. TaxID=1871066 RepID=UPI000FE33404|nr:hypothetical protein [Mesorhizobium sp.]RWH95498.1 MAG: hypothetical protein EOQ89_31120 [Mesorhizobium sp.]RWK17367.1 MAG: hypothetical protein EOR43_28145 [Mesorhizobium sp.]RWK27242.1 MAG: hypothetical protein EOR44_28245 [Mesorhizobium sp.]RWM20258.1 MAG: hypothetical protein EOR74_31260 [Mesorhizobium sp.]
MIQLAWRFLLFQKVSDLARWFQTRKTDGRKNTRKTMIEALARKLLIALWRFRNRGRGAAGRHRVCGVMEAPWKWEKQGIPHSGTPVRLLRNAHLRAAGGPRPSGASPQMRMLHHGQIHCDILHTSLPRDLGAWLMAIFASDICRQLLIPEERGPEAILPRCSCRQGQVASR